MFKFKWLKLGNAVASDLKFFFDSSDNEDIREKINLFCSRAFSIEKYFSNLDEYSKLNLFKAFCP